jgi:hypothetical protein
MIFLHTILATHSFDFSQANQAPVHLEANGLYESTPSVTVNPLYEPSQIPAQTRTANPIYERSYQSSSHTANPLYETQSGYACHRLCC